MEKKTWLLKFLSQVFTVYGITIGILNIFCLMFGEDAKEHSEIFSLGNKGIGVSIMLKFLLLTVLLRLICMAEWIIKKLPLWLRCVIMFSACFGIILGFVLVFDWLPREEPLAWILFIVCFAVCCTLSTVFSVILEKQENKKLEEALKRYKEKQ